MWDGLTHIDLIKAMPDEIVTPDGLVPALKTFLASDPRPSLVLAGYDESLPNSAPWALVYSNPAFARLRESLRRSDVHEHEDYTAFVLHASSGVSETGTYAHRPWTVFTTHRSLKIVSCAAGEADGGDVENEAVAGSETTTVTPVPTAQERSPQTLARSRSEARTESVRSDSSAGGRILDWTISAVPGMSEYVKFLRNHDWASLPIGAMDTWPMRLRQVTFSMMANPDPRLLLWGPDRLIVYNEACAPLIGQKHPYALGRGPTAAFAELWDQLAPIVSLAMEKGQCTKVTEMPLIMERAGFREETYWNFTMQPVLGEDGLVVGALDAFHESTNTVVGERRIHTIIKVSESTAVANDLGDIWDQVLSVLEQNTHDVPFALIYSVSDRGTDETSSSASRSSSSHSALPPGLKYCQLRGVIGFDKNHDAVFDGFDLSEGDRGYAGEFRKAWGMRQPTMLEFADGSLPRSLTQPIPGRAGGIGCVQAIVIPIPSLSGRNVVAFVVLGLTAQRPYDDDYRKFIQLLHDRIINSAAAVSLPKEQRLAQIAAEEAAMRHAALSRQLLLRTQEAERNEAKFMRMAQHAPVGMYLYRADGTPIYANDACYRLLGLKGDDQIHFEAPHWRDSIFPDDVLHVENSWHRLTVEKLPTTVEYRLNRPWKEINNAEGTEMKGFTWLLSTGFPELDDDGSVKTIMGWLTDISVQKWSEQMQAKRLEEALESKRQREGFIDMVSHEMRNPLSAIIQSADAILESLNHTGNQNKSEEYVMVASDAIEITQDATQTIILCARHQKRIIDDVLTMSKLDSNLLVISPDRVQAVSLAERALKMYEVELQSAEISTMLRVDESYRQHSVDEVVLDPARVLQILINLLTNAIKFTRTQNQRAITVSLSASTDRPKAADHGISYIPEFNERIEPHFLSESGGGKSIYLQFAITDTGTGLTKTEVDLLFHRFSQASHKTYGQYGGSGLGLFISKQLTELQGGQIGVSSMDGQGSTFAFFIKALRYMPEQSPTDEQGSSTASSPVPKGHSPQKRKYEGHEDPARDSIVIRESISSMQGPLHPEAKKGPISATIRLASTMSSDLNVLLVEDNIINQKVVSQQLRRHGCQVHIANHGLEALSFLQSTTFFAGLPPDPTLPAPAIPSPGDGPAGKVALSVVLMDLEMPVMDGLTCISRIREMERNGQIIGHVPVIAVTANARNEQISRALTHGMDLVITKPFRIPELLPQMEALVKGTPTSAISGM